MRSTSECEPEKARRGWNWKTRILHMSDQERKLDAIFHAARELSEPDQRENDLREACHGDAALRAKVEGLLRTAAKAEADCADRNTVTVGPGTLESVLPKEESLGAGIGYYKLLQKIGEGGCGVVYMAEQEQPVRRRVALKIVKLGMDTREVIARFEAERQALALMDHPNIAKVLDAGATATGRPYFVMELVNGIRITDYCDRNRLATPDRLELFIQVCQAIQHAHQKGIIHRDIKPSNVMVTLHDGVPVPKVIDFGIAKATQQRLTDKTLFTAFQQFIGTPAYMSPEQAEMSGLDIDTRCDIYALGVLLYELLTGRTPFDAKELMAVGLDEMRRTIREREPARPSTRLSTMLGGDLTAVAHLRQCEPPKLIHMLRGDLDWVAMKCLEKDRTRRYETANGLAADVRRHLDNLPVVARPPSVAYRVEKFVRRNRAMVAAAVMVAVVLVLGIVISAWQAVRARQAEREQGRLREAAMRSLDKERGQRKRVEEALTQTRFANYLANLQAADAELNARDVRRARERLEACPQEHRNWEWRYLRLKADASLRTLCGTNGVSCFALSPDSNWIAAGVRDGLEIRHRESGELKRLIRETNQLDSIVFSPDGAWLALGGGQYMAESIKVRVLEFDSLREVAAFVLPAGEHVKSLAFAPASKAIVGGIAKTTRESRTIVGSAFSDFVHSEGLVRRFDLAPPHASEIVGKQRYSTDFVAVSPDGRFVVSRSPLDTMVWDLVAKTNRVFGDDTGRVPTVHPVSGRILGLVPGQSGTEIRDMITGEALQKVADTVDGSRWAISPHDLAMIVDAGKNLELWDLLGKDLGASIDTPVMRYALPNSVKSLAMAADGLSAFVLDGRDYTASDQPSHLTEWDLTRGGHLWTIRRDSLLNFYAVKFTKDGRSIITGDNKGNVKAWNSESIEPFAGLDTREGGIRVIAVSPDGVHLATAHDNFAVLWDWPASKVLARWRINTDPYKAYGLEFSPDGRRLACAARAPIDLIQLWHRTALGWTNCLEIMAGERPAFAFSPDGTLLATSGGEDGRIQLRDARSGQVQRTLELGKGVHSHALAFHPGGHALASASELGVALWDLQTSQRIEFPASSGAAGLAFSPDGTRLAVAGRFESPIRLYDTTSGALVLTLREGGGRSPTFSPDGLRLAVVSGHSISVHETELPAVHRASRRASVLLRRKVEPRVDRLFAEHLLMTNVIEQLALDPSLSAAEKEIASRLVRIRGDNPDRLNRDSWEVVSKSGQSQEAYERALRWARAAVRLDKSLHVLNTLGIAHYRAGACEEALHTLLETDRQNQGKYYSRALDLAFIAMCHEKLGRHAEALALLKEVRVALDGSPDEESLGFLREAEALIGAAPTAK